jgi:hypothetical protein
MIEIAVPRWRKFHRLRGRFGNRKLSPQSNSGESGTASLIKQGEKQTKVTLDVTGASGSQPVHIHKGTCAQLDPKPAFTLSPVVNGSRRTW